MSLSEPNHWDLGTTVTVAVTFKKPDGTIFDPDTVTCRIKTPDGTKTAYVYLTDVAVVKDSTGNYHLLVETPNSGEYSYRWEGGGSAKAAGEATFWVNDSAFS